MNDNKLMNRAADNIRILAALWLRKLIPVIRAVPWAVPIL